MWIIKKREHLIKKSYRSIIVVVSVFAFMLMLGGMVQATDHKDKKDIVDTAVEAGSFNTLVAAVKAADLVETLKGTGPFTVFALTDAAFAKLPAGKPDDLLKPENKAKLKGILTYHVVSGKVMAADVVKLKTAKTVQGQALTIKVDGSTVMVNNVKVTQTDIACSNGVIHVIDTVVRPK